MSRTPMIHTPPFAIITGASQGIGAAYAKALAASGYDLLLVARRKDRLDQLRLRLLEDFEITIWTEGLDLAKPQAASTLYQLAQSCHPYVSLLINNAGFGMYGPLVDMPLSKIQDMLQVHIHVATECTRLFLPNMIKQQQGAIIFVASLAGLFPIPYMAEYAATKAFLISFSKAIAREAQKYGVKIQVCCPGYTNTEFHNTAGHRPRHMIVPHSPQEVVKTSLNALRRNKSLVTIGWTGWLTALLSRYIPLKWLTYLAGRQVWAKAPST